MMAEHKSSRIPRSPKMGAVCMTSQDTKKWHVIFFIGLIALNILIFFRAFVLREGGWYRFIWTSIVLGIGGILLLCIYKMRQQRMAMMGNSFEPLMPKKSKREAPNKKTFSPPSRAKNKRQKNKSKKKRKKR